MESSKVELLATLDELVEVLDADGAQHWSRWIQTAATRLRNGDDSGVDYLLRAYGGMGSLNDLILGQTTQHGSFAWKPNSVELNERFESLRSKAWQLAQHLSRGRSS